MPWHTTDLPGLRYPEYFSIRMNSWAYSSLSKQLFEFLPTPYSIADFSSSSDLLSPYKKMHLAAAMGSCWFISQPLSDQVFLCVEIQHHLKKPDPCQWNEGVVRASLIPHCACRVGPTRILIIWLASLAHVELSNGTEKSYPLRHWMISPLLEVLRFLNPSLENDNMDRGE